MFQLNKETNMTGRIYNPMLSQNQNYLSRNYQQYHRKTQNRCVFIEIDTVTASAIKHHQQQPSSKTKYPDKIQGIPPNDFPCSAVFSTIEKSKSILNLQDNWDDEGAIAPTSNTWSRATKFLRSNALKCYERTHIEIIPPDINAVGDGTIDLHWRKYERSLLINIKRDPDLPATFYGSDSKKNEIEGSFDLQGKNEWILMWLITKN
jgi:hypothetical protein